MICPSSTSHCRKLGDELGRDLAKVRQNLLRALPHARLMVANAVLLAKPFDKRVYPAQVVARYLREQVVVHLVLEPAAEPIHERRARNVARGGDL